MDTNELIQTNKTVKEQRIQQWEERRAKESPGFSYVANNNEKGVVQVSLDVNSKEETIAAHATISSVTGSVCLEYSQLTFAQTIEGFFHKKEIGHAVIANAVNGALLSLEPKDEIEGMLCSRLLVLHNQYMTFMARASNPEASTVDIDTQINRATKLMRLYNETVDALNKHRRKGEQRVVVQHVQVNDGGKAIVNGQVNQGGGGNDKS